jgi:AcrR family transcriptional regulator
MARIVDKEEKRNQILRAAVKVFARKGFGRSTISDIAEAAGTGKGTIYEYFETKEEIIHHSFSYFLKEASPDFEKILLSPADGREKLIRLLHFYTNIDQSDSLELTELMLDIWAEGLRQDGANNIILQQLRNLYVSAQKIFSDVILEGVEDGSLKTELPPDTLANIIIATLDGVMVHWLFDRKQVNIKKTIETLIEMLLQGIDGKPRKVK